MAETLALRLPGNTGIVVFSLLTAILIITIIKFIFALIKVYTFKKNLSDNKTENSILTQIIKKINLESRVLVINSSKPFALCFGFKQSKIYLSTKLIDILSIAELETVLKHEKYHLENRDTITLMLAVVFESLLLFFPLISDLIRQYRLERELSADKAALAGLNGNIHLSSALSKLLKFDLKNSISAVPALADTETLETRIKILTNIPYTSGRFRIKNILISLISVSVLLLLVFTPVNAVESHKNNQDIVIVCPQTHTLLYTPTVPTL